MAEIKVRITGDNADFKKHLAEASAESRMAALEMKEQFREVKEHAGEIAGENGLGKISGLLSNLTGGAVAFGAALIGGVAETVKEFMKMESLITQLGTRAGSQFVGREMAEWIGSIVTIGPNKEQLVGAAGKLFDSGMNEEDIRKWILRIQRISVGTGRPAEEIAEEVGAGNVGIMRMMEHDPLVRRAMLQFPGTAPTEAFARTADPGGLFFNAINEALATPGGQWSLLGVKAKQAQEKLGESLFTPILTREMFGPETSGNMKGMAPGVFYSNPEAVGVHIENAAKHLEGAAERQDILWRKFGDMWNVQ